MEILSTGGTAKFIAALGIPVTEVSDFTGFPEMLDGRVKTLHPKVHGGLLYRRDLPEHCKQAAEHGILPIDLVVVNLYPFEQTVAKEGVTREEAIEQIDIGGPSMLRSASKNHDAVTVVVDPADYAVVLTEMDEHKGATTLKTRERLAIKVFQRTAAYDAAIAATSTRPRKRKPPSRSACRSPRNCATGKTRTRRPRSTATSRTTSNNSRAGAQLHERARHRRGRGTDPRIPPSRRRES